MMILSIVATIVLLGALFYHRVNLLLSSVILLAWTAALGVAGLWSIWVLVPLAIILIPFNFTPMRKALISAPVFRGFRKVMPPMSRTEKEAIDAGTTWWEGDLFRGNPDWQKLHNYPQPKLTAEELLAFCKEELTGYKRPRHVEFRETLPKTNVGKILRRELRDEKQTA